MPSDEEMNEEFEKLLNRMSDPHASQKVEVCEIAEQPTMVEIVVPITVYEHPEITLLTTAAAYLRSIPRKALVSFNFAYEIRSHNLPHLVGILVLSDTATT